MTAFSETPTSARSNRTDDQNALALEQATSAGQGATDRKSLVSVEKLLESSRLALLVFEDANMSSATALAGNRSLSREPVIIGRDPTCTIVLRDPEESRMHCVFRRVGGTHLVNDIGSANGTLRNNLRVHNATLRDDDVLNVGRALIGVVEEDTREWRIHRPLIDQIYSDEQTGLLNRRGCRSRRNRIIVTPMRASTELVEALRD